MSRSMLTVRNAFYCWSYLSLKLSAASSFVTLPTSRRALVGLGLALTRPMKNRLVCSPTPIFVKHIHLSANAYVVKSDEEDFSKISNTEWKKRLTPEQFAVLRLSGTEPPFLGKYTNHSAKGTYVCVACANPLFSSVTKFHCACGWPAFTASIESAVEYEEDTSKNLNRVEVKCSKCKGHLGHIFDDGPPPTGKRFCINSVCLRFVPEA